MDGKHSVKSSGDAIMARHMLLARPLPPELVVADSSLGTLPHKHIGRAASDSCTCKKLTKLDSEDSSYDSDLDLCTLSHKSVDYARSLSKIEGSLLRLSVDSALTWTFSETLEREELSDDGGASDTSSDDDEFHRMIKEHHLYPSHVEYGVKLGYSESQVFKALKKLGTSPSQDKLLCQLIKISESARKSKNQKSSQVSEAEVPVESVIVPSPVISLRKIVVDGSNVAMSHGNKQIFSCRGIKICVDWFKARGHSDITVFVPKWRKESSRPEAPITDQEILLDLEREGLLVFTPSRFVDGRRIVCYDDRYILKTASEDDGIVVSNDNYRDLAQETPEFKKVIEERILMYSFVSDRFMPPDDPLGRNGPNLDDFLRRIPPHLANSTAPPCPYGKKCTYGNKCKFHHPERGNMPLKSVTERLQEQATQRKPLKGHVKTVSLPAQPTSETGQTSKRILARTASVTSNLQHDQPMASQLLNRSPVKNAPLSLPVDPMPQIWRQPPVSQPWPAAMQDQHENLHRPVQRQLSLNPAGDPRLNPFYPPVYPYTSVEMHHAQISRNSSAPGAFMPRDRPMAYHHHYSRLSSTSDTQINLLPDSLRSSLVDLDQGVWASNPKLCPSAWYPPTRPTYPDYHEASRPSFQQQRDQLYFHFSALFPESKVQAAMAMLPNETDSQKLCSVIMDLCKSS